MIILNLDQEFSCISNVSLLGGAVTGDLLRSSPDGCGGGGWWWLIGFGVGNRIPIHVDNKMYQKLLSIVLCFSSWYDVIWYKDTSIILMTVIICTIYNPPPPLVSIRSFILSMIDRLMAVSTVSPLPMVSMNLDQSLYSTSEQVLVSFCC